MSSTISALVVSCLKQFTHLISSHHLASSYNQVSLSLWEDELGRLRLWSANIGAHQTNHSSLDYRLRDASHIKQQLRLLLRRLQGIFTDLHNTPNEDFGHEMSSDSEGEGERQTYIELSYRSLYETINCLLQLSVAVRQPTYHDRLMKIKRSDISTYEPYDQKHVMNKFPGIQPAIANRLGSAISTRRAMLRYNEQHHMKLAHGLGNVLDGNDSAGLSETIATEFHTQSDVELDSSGSMTSSAPSLSRGDGNLAIPALPEKSKAGQPYECPYCFHIIEIFAPKPWTRHIFQDLMAYTCVFRDCPTPSTLYESRHHWLSHLQSEHAQSIDINQAGTCPLCFTGVPSTARMENHIARHLQELALFALPCINSDEDPTALPSGSSDLVFPEDGSNQQMLASENLQAAGFPPPGSALGESYQRSMDPKVKKDFEGLDHTTEYMAEASKKPCLNTEEAPLRCMWTGCSNTLPFKRKADLARHVQSRHISPQSFRCNVEGCIMRFNRKDSLQEHVRSFHKEYV